MEKNNTEAFKEYLQFEKKYSPYTVNGYLDDIISFEKFNKEVFQQDKVDQVNYSQIRSWIVFLVDNNLSNTSINRKIASLKAYFKFLLKIKVIEVNPLLKHRALKTEKKLQIPFSEKELFEGLSQSNGASGFQEIRDRLIVELFYASGMRRSELIHLKINTINDAKSTLKVIGKRNKERIIPVLPGVLKLIQGYIQERSKLEKIEDVEYLFLSKKGLKLSESFVYRLINSYFSTVSEKVKKSPHIIRHTFATHLLNNGADLNSVKELLGHSSLASTQVYTHSSLSELKKVYKEAHPRNKK